MRPLRPFAGKDQMSEIGSNSIGTVLDQDEGLIPLVSVIPTMALFRRR